MIKWPNLTFPPINLLSLPWWIEYRNTIEREDKKKSSLSERREDFISNDYIQIIKSK